MNRKPDNNRLLISISIRLVQTLLLAWAAAAWTFPIRAAALPGDWQREQAFEVSNAGLIKLDLPIETLDSARPGLEDLRLYDNAGNEIPYLIHRPIPVARIVRDVSSFRVSLNPDSTVVSLQTGLSQSLDDVLLESPAENFIKSVRVEGSTDGNRWQSLAQGQMIFRQANGASMLHVGFPNGSWPWLRLIIDDRRSPPIPFTSARIRVAVSEPAPTDWLPATISERHENPGETRMELNLGAANLSVASVRVETSATLFTRQMSVAWPQMADGTIQEQTVSSGTIYRMAIEGQPASESLVIPAECQPRSRELLLFIRNLDSPPLPITSVRVERRPIYLVFLARSPGIYHLMSGNYRCNAAHYDLAGLAINLKSIPIADIKLSPPEPNPDFHTPEVLPGVDGTGMPLDVTGWQFRKSVDVAKAGAQQLELDLDVLAHAQPGLGDLRLLRGSNQVPYIISRTSISRSFAPAVAETNGVDGISRWSLKLPNSRLPISRLSMSSPTPLFQRDFTVYAELKDERGGSYRQNLGGGTWIQTPDRTGREFVISLNQVVPDRILYLETKNGDNPPVALDQLRLFYPATRILFKSASEDAAFLYYGNSRAASPRYDLNLMADELLAAEKTMVSMGGEQQLIKTSWRETRIASSDTVMFWGILALVVALLFVIISRLLPKQQPPPAGNAE